MTSEPDSPQYPGEYCQRAGLTEEVLLRFNEIGNSDLRLPSVRPLTNGLVFELAQFKDAQRLAWTSVYRWLSAVSDGALPLSVQTLTVRAGRLKRARAALVKSKLRSKIEGLMAETFVLPSAGSKTEGNVDISSEQSVIKGDEQSYAESDTSTCQILAAEINELEDKLRVEQGRCRSLEASAAKWYAGLRNLRKQLRRRDQKIECSTQQEEEYALVVDGLEATLEEMASSVKDAKLKVVAQQKRVYWHKSQAESARKNISVYEDEVSKLSSEVQSLKGQVSSLTAELELERAEAREHVDVIESKVDGQYTSEVRQCCLNLLAMNVGVWNIKPVIRCVLALAEKRLSDYPSVALCSQLLVELKAVSSLHVADALTEGGSFNTLHSDGTTKFGNKYGSYQIASATNVFSVGLVDMKSGTTQHTMDMLKEVLSDIDSLAAKAGKMNAGAKILASVKNTMSDSSSVQKNFNGLVEAYRAEILPTVVEGWTDLSADQQAQMLQMNNFFCGLHYIVNLAEHTAEALKGWEQLHFADGEKKGAAGLPGAWESSESGGIRMIRTVTKAVEKHGDEAAGCVGDFYAFMENNKLPVPLTEFRGNRYYVIFYNGAGVYFLHECLSNFLTDVHGETNRLLRSVKADLDVVEFVAEARALGLINKLVVAPLWCALEDKTKSVSDMSTVYSELVEKLTTWSRDASGLVDGTARPFTGAAVPACRILDKLLEPSELHDDLTLEILQAVCTVLRTFSGRYLKDHLPGGTFHKVTTELAEQTASVAKTNAISERDFAQLDRLLREKPNAQTVALEGMILFANNKTGAWLQSKSMSEQAAILQLARQAAPQLRDKFRER